MRRGQVWFISFFGNNCLTLLTKLEDTVAEPGPGISPDVFDALEDDDVAADVAEDVAGALGSGDPDLDHLVMDPPRSTVTTRVTERVLEEQEGPAMFTRSSKRAATPDGEQIPKSNKPAKSQVNRPSKRQRLNVAASVAGGSQRNETAGDGRKDKGKSQAILGRRGVAVTRGNGRGRGRGRGR